jgi:cell wall assembly regulator SMI1
MNSSNVQHRVEHAWGRVIAGLGSYGGTVRARPGRSDLGRLEGALGFALPEDYRAWLALHDGEQDVPGRVDFLPAGGFLLPSDTVLERWVDPDGWNQSDKDPGYAEFQDDDRIRNVVRHARRVMIASNRYGDGDNTYLDFCPGPAGVAGQVIVATSECDFEVVGSSFEDLLRRLATALEDGLLETRAAERGNPPRVVAKGTAYGRWESVLRGLTPR